ncbi:MAG: hypothetical protein ACE5FL_15920 [Myxococcota bacterium]
MKARIRRSTAALLAAGVALAAAGPAAASPETLRRAVGNMLFAPVDLALSPIVAGHTIYRNLNDIDDSLGVRLAYPIPGFAWNVGLQVGAAAIREIAGVLEFLPGLILLPFEADMTPLFAPAEKADALVDVPTPPIDIKFGIDYTSVPY